MGNITINIPQNIQIEYTLDNGLITKHLLETLNTMMLRLEPSKAEANDLLGLFADQAEVLDHITESAMQSRETDPLRVD
jgi:hypothetical protein